MPLQISNFSPSMTSYNTVQEVILLQNEILHSVNSTSKVSIIDHSVDGNRLYERSDGSVGLAEKPIGYVIGEQVLRPIINTVYSLGKNFFCSTYSLFLKFDKHLSFPVVEALPNIQTIRSQIAALEDIALTEDMVARIVEDKTGNDIEPGVVKAVKKLIDILGTISNPSNFYGNLIQGGLENEAVEKLKELEKKKQGYDKQLEKFLTDKKNRKKISELRASIKNINKQIENLKSEEEAKYRTASGIEKEIAETRKKMKQLPIMAFNAPNNDPDRQEWDRLKAIVDRLLIYLSETRIALGEFTDEREDFENNIKTINQQIKDLTSNLHDEL